MESQELIAQSLPLCYVLSAIGGILEVGSMAVLAVPDAREKEGVKLPWWLPKVALASNVIMQLLGSISSNLFATWFGPVSVVAPIYFSATLVSNLIIFGIILGLEFFDRIMCVGTYVIAIGTILLQVVGPGIQDDQDIRDLLIVPYALVWFLLLLVGMTISTIFVARSISERYGENKQVLILLVARSTSYTLNLTVSRAFLLNPTHFMLVAFVVIKVVSGAVYTYAIVVQSTTVTQSKFVPLNATLVILVNAITGVIIWQDWRVISSWTGYICVFLLLALGCDLLLSAKLLISENPDYGTMKQTSILIESTPEPIKRIFKLERSRGSRNLYGSIQSMASINQDSALDGDVGIHNYFSRTVSVVDEGSKGNRRESWKKVLSVQKVG